MCPTKKGRLKPPDIFSNSFEDTRAWLKLSDLKSSAGCELRFHEEVRANQKAKEIIEGGNPDNYTEMEIKQQIFEQTSEYYALPTDSEIKKTFQWNKNVLESMCHDQYSQGSPTLPTFSGPRA